jgi:hypothetical protein
VPDIFAFGFALQPTSFAMITTTSDIFNQDGIRQSTPTSATIVTTNPTFGGVQTATAQLNGSILVTWNAATGPNGPYVYDVYVQEGTSINLFSPSNWMQTDSDTQTYVFEYTGNNILRSGFTYFIGVKARDPLGNISISTASVFAVSSGVQPGRSLAPSDIPAIVNSVWNELQSGHTIAGSFGSYLDSQVSTKSSQSSVNLIPTNPLLTTDSRLNNLDAAISSRSNQTSVDNINSKIGIPVGTVSSDIADVKSDTNAIRGKTDAILLDGSNYVRSRIMVNDDKTDYALSTSTIDGIADAVWDEDRTSHSVSGTFGESNQGIVSASRANNLDNLDDSISSRSSQITANTILSRTDVATSTRASQTTANSIDSKVDVAVSTRASQASVDNIQNNTDFVGIVPTTLILPVSGSSVYPFYTRLFDSSGSPVDPDSNQMNVEILDSVGGTVVSLTSMTRTGVGQYEYEYTVNSSDTERALYVFFTYLKSSVSFNQVRSTQVQEFESKLDTLIARITPARAANLDNLDETISSRAAQTTVNTILSRTDVATSTRASQSVADAINTKVDVTLSTRATQSSVDAVFARTDVATSTRASQASVDAIPTAAEIADAVLEEDVNDHATGTSLARTVKDAKIFSQIDL